MAQSDTIAVDVAAVTTLRGLEQALTPLVDAVSDSLILSGSEAYQAALVFYNNAKGAAKLRVHGAQGIYDDLAARFPGAGSVARPAAKA